MNQWDLTQEYRVGFTSENESMQYKILGKIPQNYSINTEKTVDKIQHPFMISSTQKAKCRMECS